MAGTDPKANDVIPFETNTRRRSIASEIIARTKERKQMDARGGKSPYNSKYLPKRKTATYYKPAFVKNSALALKGRHQTRKSSELDKSESQRNSTDKFYAAHTQSTKIFNLDDRSLIYEKSNNVGSNTNYREENSENEYNILPPLTDQLDNLALQPKKHYLQNLRQRQRSFSGQSASKPSNDALSFKKQRSSSFDYSNTKTLLKFDSRSSSFASGCFTQFNGALSNASNSMQAKTNSVKSASNANRTTSASLHRSVTMSDMLDASKRKNTERLSPEDALHSGRKPKRTPRSNGVYSPLSVASAEKPRSCSNPIISRRRASLPASTLAVSNMISETSRSREFFEALHDLKQEDPVAKPGRTEATSSPPSTRREVLHIIEEVHPEASYDAGQSKKTDIETSDTKNGDHKQNESNDNKLSDVVLETNVGSMSPLFINDVACPNNTDKTREQSSEKAKKTSFFDISEDPADSKKVFSRLEKKNLISNNEQNQHFVVEPTSHDLEREKSCPLLAAAAAFYDDYLDNSVVFKDDDDLCDEDFLEKRIILWLMDVSTGEDAEAVTRITPPSSPDLSTLESAIRVVYNGD